ncbi:hypothetical protein MVEN_01263000 [Mycena venus]|uniref:Uncharacterized protein n=1 Tax=Mycena venus TaxID=2733690 RepID=A0A8H6Y6T9_9AGAR|nr:hypothetical protein MVEN_01263000 [Mycena venus]
MSANSMSGLAYPLLRFTGLRPLHRFLQGPPRHSSGISLVAESTTHPISLPPPVDRIRQRNFDLLLESLEIDGNPSRVWTNYTNLLTFLGYERLPVEVHQQVLRKCTPSSRLLRASATRRLFLGNVPRLPHVYEGRLQAVIRNIRSTGTQPSLDDYNFVLEQFAAVGHHFGVMQVYRELTSVGVVPRTKTFGLCLQAIAHRLTLPVARKDRAQRVAVTRRMVSDIVNAMKSYNIPFTSVNLDLTMRILKETTDMQGFEMLMRWGYGIDLANPDCSPLEYLESLEGKGPTPQPFSTAALNTTIDTLGRLGNISRMVQAFETTMTISVSRLNLRLRGRLHFLPSAPPNTTTYNTLLRHVSRAGHAVFARHYLLQAMELEKQTLLDLKYNLGNMALEEVPAPHFAINRGTLLSVFGESNRDKNVGLMRWLHSKFPRILKKKRNEYQFFIRYRAGRQRKRLWPYERHGPAMYTPLGLAPLRSTPKHGAATLAPETPVLKSKRQPRFMTVMERWKAPKGVGEVFDVDLEDERPLPATPRKTFDLDLHICVLERDILEIEALYAHVQTILARTTGRVKERLGRRVWHGRDIYLQTSGDKRRRVSMQEWEKIAGIKAYPGQRQRKGERYVFPWSDPANRRRHINPSDGVESPQSQPGKLEGTETQSETR